VDNLVLIYQRVKRARVSPVIELMIQSPARLMLNALELRPAKTIAASQFMRSMIAVKTRIAEQASTADPQEIVSPLMIQMPARLMLNALELRPAKTITASQFVRSMTAAMILTAPVAIVARAQATVFLLRLVRYLHYLMTPYCCIIYK